jgi:hypothetical protein
MLRMLRNCLSGRPISSSFGHNVSSVQKFANDLDGTRNCTFCANIMGTPRYQMNCQLCQSLQSCQYKRCLAYVHMNGCPPDIEAHPGYYGIWVSRDLESSNIATIPNLILEFFKQSTILRGLLSMSANWSQEDTWLTCNFPSMTFSLMKLWLHIVLHNHLCIPCSKESQWQSHEKFLSIISQHLSRPQHVGMRIWYQK